MKIKKHPAAVARDKWLESPEGVSATQPTTLNAPAFQRQYLENRLTRAFAAGWVACEKHQRAAAVSNTKLTDAR